jgi:hypothetical protein
MVDCAEYLSSIKFRFIKPHHRIPLPESFYDKQLAAIIKSGRSGLAGRIGLWLEMVNTKLPEDDETMKEKLRELCRIPRMSTLAFGAIINMAVQQLNHDDAFVNVGVWHGFTLLCGMAFNREKKCIGIDNFSEFGGPREIFLKRFNYFKGPRQSFFEMDYQDYFSNIHSGYIGFYIYDGRHSYKDQLNGLRVAEPFFSDDCLILVDDTNWEEPRQATLDFIAGSSNSYRMLLDVKTRHNSHPTYWNGLMVFQRITQRP